MNRAEMRDRVRRLLGIKPPIDTSDPDAKAGDEPIQQPYPHNALINQVIDSTAALVNAQLGIAIDSIIRSVTVSAQTADGPYRLDLGLVDDYAVMDAWWNNGSNDAILRPTSFTDLNRDGIVWSDEAPSTPDHIIVEGMSLYLYPAPASAGTLKLRCKLGISGPTSDADTFHQLPRELVDLMVYPVVIELADSLPDDVEMASRARAFGNKAAVAVDAIARWVNTTNMRYQPSISALPYRHGGR